MSFLFKVDTDNTVKDVREDLDVKMVGHHHQQDPVTKTKDTLEIIPVLVRDTWGHVDQEYHPDLAAEHSDEPDDDLETGDDEKEDEPEPEQDVDLVIHHVDGENAETIKPTT